MNKPASELIARLEVSQRACFDAGLHVAAMDIQSARAEIARTAANQSGSERAGVDARGPVEVKQVHKLRHLLNHMPDKDFHLPREEAQELLRYIEALATPPAQPAPAEHYPTGITSSDHIAHDLRCGRFPQRSTIEQFLSERSCPSEAPSTHGKPDGAVREAALRLLAVEDERQSKLHDLLETIREQIRLEVPVEHRPAGLFKNIQDAVYTMRGRTPLMNDMAVTVLHSTKIAAAETSPGDGAEKVDWTPFEDGAAPWSEDEQFEERAKACKSRCKQYGYTCGQGGEEDYEYEGECDDCDRDAQEVLRKKYLKPAAIDRLDVKAEAKSQEPEAVAIKPLEWVDNDSERVGSRAQTILGEYVTWISEDECCYLQLASQFKGHPHGASIDAAKAAAQSDYEQRIRSALIHPPAVSVDAETIEAAARIIDPDAFEKWDNAQGNWRKDEARVACWPAEEKATAIAALIAGGR